MSISVAVALIITVLAYAGMALYVLRREETLGAEWWMVLYCLWSILLAGAIALNSPEMQRLPMPAGIWLVVISLVGVCILGGLTFHFLEIYWASAWLAGGLILAAWVTWANARDPATSLSELSWRTALVYRGSWLPWIAVVLWGLAALALIGLTFRMVARARLPLHANRRLWWLVTLGAILFGEAIALWGSGTLALVGQAMRALGVLSAAYAATAHDLIDLRSFVRAGIGNAVFIATLILILLAGIGASFLWVDRLPESQWPLAVGVTIVALALVYQYTRPRLVKLIDQVVLAAGYNTAQIAAEYSQRAATILDVDELAATVGETLSQAVQAERVALLLLTPNEHATQAEVIGGAGHLPADPHEFDQAGIFLSTIFTTRKPVLQYSIDYSPQFKPLDAADRAWLGELGVDAYVPIFDGETLSGILAVGSRRSGDPYRAAELGLLSAIADQTSVALKNARLVTDLRSLNEEMRALNEEMQLLNKSLAESNERLKQLDKVKADFISIASHELRTPLTKIRGYSDILKDVSITGRLDAEQMASISGQLIRACDRLEEVITQMLDVSQLDVELISMNLVETHMETVLRQALEPFSQAVRERGQKLTVRGIQSLPAMQGDVQRLVQAFKQIISNAVKYTPDGGRIDVYARRLPANRQMERFESIEVVVADSGVGIDPEHHDLIFEKFFRVGSTSLHSTGTTKFMGAGPGLGLTIARGIIESHGGQIWVESEGHDPDRCPGSQFHIVLPLKPLPLNKVNRTS